MKYFLLFITGFVCCCCEHPSPAETPVRANSGTWYRIATIDNCEYIVTDVYGGTVMVHKANCPNHKP